MEWPTRSGCSTPPPTAPARCFSRWPLQPALLGPFGPGRSIGPLGRRLRSQLQRLATPRAAAVANVIRIEYSADTCLCGLFYTAVSVAAEEGALNLKLCLLFPRQVARATSEITKRYSYPVHRRCAESCYMPAQQREDSTTFMCVCMPLARYMNTI